MPHMMPMFWLSMMLYTFIIFLSIIMMIYFMYLPMSNISNYSLNKFKWNWKW